MPSYRQRKTGGIILGILLLLLIVFFSFVNKKAEPENSITEPDVPVSNEVSTEVLGEQAGIEAKPSSGDNREGNTANTSDTTQSSDNQDATADGDTPTETTEPGKPTIAPENAYSQIDLGNVKKVIYSEDKSKLLVLENTSATADSGFSLIPQISAQESDGYTLKLTNKDGVVTKVLETNKVLDAAFYGNDYVYYQTAGTSAGVYRYKLTDDSKQVIEYTYDPQTFNNITMISSVKYFFIQPMTGTMGFGTVGSTDKTILDEKALNASSNYARQSAYRFASLSPDKKYIAVYDLAQDDSNQVKVIIYPVNATNKEDIYFEGKVMLAARGLGPGEKILQWSKDSKYLSAGDNGYIVDVQNKKLIKLADSLSTQVKFSPDVKQAAVIDYANNKTIITDLNGQLKFEVGKDVSHVDWLNNQLLLVVIGQRLYVYSTSQKQLFAVNKDRFEYTILDTNGSEEAMIKKGDDSVLVVRAK